MSIVLADYRHFEPEDATVSRRDEEDDSTETEDSDDSDAEDPVPPPRHKKNQHQQNAPPPRPPIPPRPNFPQARAKQAQETLSEHSQATDNNSAKNTITEAAAAGAPANRNADVTPPLRRDKDPSKEKQASLEVSLS